MSKIQKLENITQEWGKHILIPGYSSYRVNEFAIRGPKAFIDNYWLPSFAAAAIFDFTKFQGYIALIEQVSKYLS